MADGNFNVAVFGAGFGAYCLIPAFQRDPRAKVVALCAPSPRRRDDACEKYGIAHGCSSVADVFAATAVDIAAIAVPPAEQPAIANECLKRGIPVLAEKPLAADLASARSLASAAETAAVPTAVDFLFPELLPWREAKQRLDAGRIGSLRHVVVTWLMESYDVRNRLSGWKTDNNVGGGVMSHFGCHTIYYLEWLCGQITDHHAVLRSPPGCGDTLATLTITFASGATGSVTLCSAAPHGPGHNIYLYGTDGALALINDPQSPVSFRLFEGLRDDPAMRGVTLDEPDPPSPGEDPRVASIARLVSRFIDSIAGGHAMTPDFDNGVRVQEILSRIANQAGATPSARSQ